MRKVELGASRSIAVEAAFYLYGILFILICMIACCVSACIWLVTRQKLWVGMAGYHFFYLIEAALIFFEEYIGNKPIWIFAGENPQLTYPFIKLIVSVGIVSSVWYMIQQLTSRYAYRRWLIVTVGTCLAEAISLAISDGDLQQFAFYILRDLLILGCVLYAVVIHRATKEQSLADYLGAYRGVLGISTALMLLTLLQDVVTMGFKMPLLYIGSVWAQFISGRNIAENAAVIVLAVLTVRHAIEVLVLRFKEPPNAEMAQQGSVLEVRLARFCEHHDISIRERDIVQGMLEGKSNRQMAGDLFISEGTVKAHAHSIYKKCGVSSRKEVQQLFWSE